MATKAYFMINVAEESCRTGYDEIVRDLQTIPEVKSVEPVNGRCDLLVQVEAPIRVIMVAHKVMDKKWVKRLNILTVEPVPQTERRRSQREILERLKAAWSGRPITVR